MPEEDFCWPHAPPHFLASHGTFMVTAGTYTKEHFFRSRKRLRLLTKSILHHASEHGWSLEAWAVFSNHYHWIGQAPEDKGASGLADMIANVHRKSAIALNELDATPGRRVWHNYFETRLTFQRSYLARLHYVSQNPVKHGLVLQAVDYPWCSAGWMEKNSSPGFRKTLASFKIDKLRIPDDY